MHNLWYRCAFASAAFFCSKNSRADGQGLVGIDEESVAEAVRRRVWKMFVNLFSNFRFEALEDEVECPMMLFSTIVSRLEFIFSRREGSPLGDAVSVDGDCSGSTCRKDMWRSLHFLVTDGRTEG